jgi:hypothetical protein
MRSTIILLAGCILAAGCFGPREPTDALTPSRVHVVERTVPAPADRIYPELVAWAEATFDGAREVVVPVPDSTRVRVYPYVFWQETFGSPRYLGYKIVIDVESGGYTLHASHFFVHDEYHEPTGRQLNPRTRAAFLPRVDSLVEALDRRLESVF